MATYPDWYNPGMYQPRKSKLELALDSLSTIALGWMHTADKKFLESQKENDRLQNYKRNVRASEINR